MQCILTHILGITTDLLVYSIIIPVLPFQLERLSYHQVSALTGWLLFAYVRPVIMFIYSLTYIY
jgi:DHA1 family solute carrier family 18 vesicular amine transporter 1/2